MPLKDRDINPLAVANLRQLTFCPVHFQKFTFTSLAQAKRFTDWIYENSDGRFYISSKRHPNITIGFENHYEATIFALKLPEINLY